MSLRTTRYAPSTSRTTAPNVSICVAHALSTLSSLRPPAPWLNRTASPSSSSSTSVTVLVGTELRKENCFHKRVKPKHSLGDHFEALCVGAARCLDKFSSLFVFDFPLPLFELDLGALSLPPPWAPDGNEGEIYRPSICSVPFPALDGIEIWRDFLSVPRGRTGSREGFFPSFFVEKVSPFSSSITIATRDGCGSDYQGHRSNGSIFWNWRTLCNRIELYTRVGATMIRSCLQQSSSVCGGREMYGKVFPKK